jgi:3',5'-nucleoside bisphosphate phosphatase
MKQRTAMLLPCVFFFVLAATVEAQVRDRLPVPDVGPYRTLKCDFHMHTVFSDGQVWPPARVAEAWRDGLDAIAITDHSGGGRNKEILKPDLNLPDALARPLAGQFGVLLVPGVEVAQGLTHCNALFIKDANEVNGMELLPALRKLRAQGAYILWNHPGWRRPAIWYPDIDAARREKLIDGFEIVNDTEIYPDTLAWSEEKQLALFANSDVHGTFEPQDARTRRPVTLAFVRTADLAGLREALEARRTVAWFREDVWGAEEFVRGLWQGAIKIDPARLSFTRQVRRAGVRIDNTSAIPFRVKVKSAPAWLNFSAGEVPGQRVVFAGVSAGKDAPAGEHRVEVVLEVTSLHIAPAKNLTVSLPLVVTVE